MYYVHLACSLHVKCKHIDEMLAKQSRDRLTDLVEDQKDISLLLLDILELSQAHISTIICNSFVVYVLVPLLGAFTCTEKGAFSINLSLYLLL